MENLDPYLLESIVMGNNQAQTTGSFDYGNPMVPSFVLDDPNLLPYLPNPSPLLNEALPDGNFSSMVGFMPEGTTSLIQEQDFAGCYSPFYQPLNDNSLMFQGLDRSYEYNSNNQLLVPNVNENNIFNGINHNSPSYPPMLQYPVEQISGIGTGIPHGQIMPYQMPPLSPLHNEHITTSHMLWSFRPEPTFGVQLQQVAPVYANTVTTRRGEAIALEPASSRVLLPSIMDQNAVQMVSSDHRSALVSPYQDQRLNLQIPSTLVSPYQNQRLNLQNGTELAREAPQIATRRSRTIEGRELPHRGYPLNQLEMGESSSAKRHKKDSCKEGTGDTEPKAQEANKTAENVEVENQNDNFTTSSVVNSWNGLYDPRFELIGLPIDPHIRFWKAQQDPEKNGYYHLG